MRIARSTLGAVVALSLAVLLSACSIRPGAAAVVDGKVISQSELESAQTELAPLISGVKAEDILSVLIAAPIYLRTAPEHGVGVSQSDAEKLLASVAAQKGLPAGHHYGPGALDMARLSLASLKLSKLTDGSTIIAKAQEEIGKQTVVVNPRYGTFDAKTGQVSLVEPDWIAPTPSK